MKTSRIISITAALFALAASTASARPAGDPQGSHASPATASTSASIAAHHEQMSAQQYLASHGQSAPTPQSDRTETDTGGGLPIVFVLIGVTVPLGLALASLAARPVRAYARRRHPAGVA
jgi:membrane protein insertase Oxa1/YidC/SpoIIIJ